MFTFATSNECGKKREEKESIKAKCQAAIEQTLQKEAQRYEKM